MSGAVTQIIPALRTWSRQWPCPTRSIGWRKPRQRDAWADPGDFWVPLCCHLLCPSLVCSFFLVFLYIFCFSAWIPSCFLIFRPNIFPFHLPPPHLWSLYPNPFLSYRLPPHAWSLHPQPSLVPHLPLCLQCLYLTPTCFHLLCQLICLPCCFPCPGETSTPIKPQCVRNPIHSRRQ